MTIDNDLDRIAIYISKLDPHDIYKEALEKEYELYRDIIESIPVDESPPDRLVSSIFSLLQRLKNYVVFGNTNNPLVQISPTINKAIESIEEKSELLKEVKTNPTFIASRKQKIDILLGYLANIDIKGKIDDIRNLISLVCTEYQKCNVYSNKLEQELAKAKYYYVIRLIEDGSIEEATTTIQDYDSDMLLFIHTHHKESINTLLKNNKAFLANEMYHFLNEYQDEKINDIEFWKILAQIEKPEIEINSIKNNNDTYNTPKEEPIEVQEEKPKFHIRKFWPQFFNRTYKKDTFSIVFSPCDYIRITLRLFVDFKMVLKEFKKLENKIKRITAVHGKSFKEITIHVVQYKQVHSYSLDDAVDIHKTLKDIFGHFSFNIYNNIVALDLSLYGAVSEIPERAFEELPITKVILPNNCKKINQRAFYECKSLREVVMPQNYTLNRIGPEAFKNCESLEEIDMLHQDFNSNGLEEGCFSYCSRLKKVTLSKYLEVIPEECFAGSGIVEISLSGIYEIEKSAFSFCKFLEKVILTHDLRIIGKNAFYGCERLKNFSFPCVCGNDEQLEIEDEAFSLSGLKKVYIDSEKLILGEAVFKETSLKKVVLYSEIKSLPERLFDRCYELEEVKLPTDLESIEEGCFSHCNSLKIIKLPKTVKRLGKECFYGCCELQDINIPENLEYVGNYVFADCVNITDEIRKKFYAKS